MGQLPSELIRKQLQKIAVSEEFKKSVVLIKFLQFTVETTLAGKEEEIKEHTIGVKALGRAKDFNPQLDAIVRIHATRLRKMLSAYYLGPGKDDPVIISIPKGTYIPQFKVKGRNETGNDLSNGTKTDAGELPNYFPEPASPRPVLAVLPFRDLSPQPLDTVFITALGEDLSLQLAKFDSLSVISFYVARSLSISRDLKQINLQTGIDYLITGSVLSFNEMIKMNVQLTRVADSNIVWSNSFLQHRANGVHPHEIIEDIIGRIANTLADEHGILYKLDKRFFQRKPETSIVVADAIQSYFDFSYHYDMAKFDATLRKVEKAYQVAGNNVLILSILSKLYLDQYACAIEEDKGLLEKGIALAKSAVELNPLCQYAQKALAWGLTLTGDKHQSMKVIDNCVNINPAASSTLSTMGLGLVMMGEYNRGYSLLMKSANLGEHTPACGRLGLSLYYYKKKNYEESRKWLDRTSPFDIPFVHLLKTAITGHTDSKLSEPDNFVVQLNGHKKNIIERIVLDAELKKNIMEGIAQAG